jgi:hypothetical protein
MYAGAYGSGTIRLVIALAAAAMIAVPATIAYERRSDLGWHRDWPLLVTSIAGGAILVSDYSLSYQDALREVIERNERGEQQFEERHPDAP